MSIIDNVLHARALQEFGRGYLSPTRTDSVLGIIFERIDKAEAHAKQLARELELMHDIAISHSGRVEELEAQLLLLGPIENAEKSIRDAGGDPEQIVKDGASFARALMAEKKLRASEARLKEFEKWTTELCNALEYAEDYCVYEGRLDEDEKMTLVFEEWQAKLRRSSVEVSKT